MGLPVPSMPSDVTLMFPNMFFMVTVLNFVVPGVIFDFVSFSFHVPICGSAAKHAATPKKQNARVKRKGFFLIPPSNRDFRFASILSGSHNRRQRLWQGGQPMIFEHDRRTHREDKDRAGTGRPH